MEDSCKKLNDRIEALFGGLQYVKIPVGGINLVHT